MGKWRFCLRCQFCGFMDENHEKSSLLLLLPWWWWWSKAESWGGKTEKPRRDEMRGRYTLLIIIVVDQRERERERCTARKKETVWQMRRIFLLGESTKRVSRCAQLPERCSLPGIQIPRLTRCLSIFCNCDCVNAESSAIVQVRVSFLGISLCSLTGDHP
jgi:hypothetical protein